MKDVNILVVDDEKEIADLVELYLLNEGYNVLKFYSSKEALSEIHKNNDINFAIIDVMMPEIDGFELCKLIRENHKYPVIMLTAKIEDIDKIRGLSQGADDYITKPFNPLEMIARVKAQIRRYTSYNESEKVYNNENIIEFSGLFMNNETHEFLLYDKEIILTPIEFSILWYLCKNKGKVISTEKIFEDIWNEKYFDSNNTVMVHIRHIREKMGESQKNPKFIKTVWGVGYKIDG